MLSKAFSLNLKKYPEVDFSKTTKSVILILSFAGYVLYKACYSFIWNLFDPKSWVKRYELVLTNSVNDNRGRTASTCCYASKKTPYPPLAFYETLLSI